jgi:hypothetical protein
LLHEYSESFPIYADFNEDGVGSFYSNPDVDIEASDIRNRLFNIKHDSHKATCLRIETSMPGEIYFKNEDFSLGLKTPAQVKKCTVSSSVTKKVAMPTVSAAPLETSDLEQMSCEIKKQLADFGNNLETQLVRQWIDQFRNQRVSIIALESLLNFYSKQRENDSIDVRIIDETAFQLLGTVEDDADIIKCRNEINRLEKENKRLSDELSNWKKWFITAAIVATILLLVSIISLMM